MEPSLSPSGRIWIRQNPKKEISMSTKRILAKEIDANQSYEVIGLDLAKDNVSFVGITTGGEVIRVDRVEYSTLIEKAHQMDRTVFGMEK